MFKLIRNVVLASMVLSIGLTSLADAKGYSSRSYSSRSYSSYSSRSSSSWGWRASSKSSSSSSSPSSSSSSSFFGMTKKPLSSSSTSSSSTSSSSNSSSSFFGMTKKPMASSSATSSSSTEKKKDFGSMFAPSSSTKNSFDKSAERSLSRQSFSQYQADKNRSKMASSPVTASAARSDSTYTSYRSTWKTPDSYYARRHVAYSETLSRQPPTVIYIHDHMRPNYGVFDGLFLGMLLNDITRPSYYNWAYAHYNDPSFQQWHADAMQLAQQNGEMKAKLDAMDAQMRLMQANGVKPQASNILPENIDPTVAIAPEAVNAEEVSTEDNQSAMQISNQEEGSFPWKTLIVLSLIGFLVFFF